MKPTNLRTDEFKISKGNIVKVNFIKHASLFFEINNYIIHVDPVSEFADFSAFPKADLILYTHDHYDHFCANAVEHILTEKTEIICTLEVETALKNLNIKNSIKVLKNGEIAEISIPDVEFSILAVPAYNTTQTQFHPKGRDNGYVLMIDDIKFYIPGDCEDMPELVEHQDYEVVFLPVNQPYTMTIDQCVNAVQMMRPKVFYPIHCGDTDINVLMDRLKDIKGTEVRLCDM
ncbi:MAG: MBL fold metallo-hydrolase [Bacteroidales bacterium]|jgi:L-ascorbate metabolism protein UlaG (beta-lactamase superfamily)|nr:MBL fold metallo-hydrolase [Bacteroidales bacterium]